MMNHIDVSSVLRQTLACDLYSNLVTRSTGAAVRTQIEHLVSEARERALTVIDFSQVSMIDFSCADEIVAKLLMRYASDDAPQVAYFLFRGVTDDHWDAIGSVLERHGLALVLEHNGLHRVVGVLSEDERRAWEAIYRIGPAAADEVAIETGTETMRAREALDALCRRRLVMQADGQYMAVGDRHG